MGTAKSYNITVTTKGDNKKAFRFGFFGMTGIALILIGIIGVIYGTERRDVAVTVRYGGVATGTKMAKSIDWQTAPSWAGICLLIGIPSLVIALRTSESPGTDEGVHSIGGTEYKRHTLHAVVHPVDTDKYLTFPVFRFGESGFIFSWTFRPSKNELNKMNIQTNTVDVMIVKDAEDIEERGELTDWPNLAETNRSEIVRFEI